MQHKASGAKPLYGYRPVMNAEALHKWASDQGFDTALHPDDMHVTVVFSKDAFSSELTSVAESDDNIASWGQIIVRGGKRSVEPLGDKGAVVLKIENSELVREHLSFRDRGASWDFPTYMPHITITYSGMPAGDIEPFGGDIILGAMRVKPMNAEWVDDIREVSVKSVASKSMQHKSLSIPFELKREPDADGYFEGYAAVFENVDRGMDVIQRGAFAKSLGSGRKVKLLWQHDMGSVIGVLVELREDERGLYVKGRLLADVRKGAEALSLLRAGAIDGISIGYRVVQATKEGGGSVRRLLEVDLYEVSLVTMPMNELATVTDVKSVDWSNKREVEAGLRDVFGLTQGEAKAFMADGFAGLAAKRDVASDDPETEDGEDFAEIMDLLRQLQENLNV